MERNNAMQITTVLFDLDGTLLPMDQEEFTRGYFSLLATKLAPHGYEPQALVRAVWAGTASMVKNDGSRTNEAAFWDTFSEIYGPGAREDLPLFEDFYARDFEKARAFCQYNPAAPETVRLVRTLGLRTALATNPIFPAIATEQRIRWAGLTPEDFALYTTYENTGFCKPNPDYFRDVASRLDMDPAQCLMVGNDASEDLAAAETGMQVFLLTDCLINQTGRDISLCPHGGFEDLSRLLRTL